MDFSIKENSGKYNLSLRWFLCAQVNSFAWNVYCRDIRLNRIVLANHNHQRAIVQCVENNTKGALLKSIGWKKNPVQWQQRKKRENEINRMTNGSILWFSFFPSQKSHRMGTRSNLRWWKNASKCVPTANAECTLHNAHSFVIAHE